VYLLVGVSLQRNERLAGRIRDVAVAKPISHEIGVTFRVLKTVAVAAYWIAAPSMPSPFRGTGLRGVPATTSGQRR
jgi:hypothetical protein